VVAQFNGELSGKIFRWFNRLIINREISISATMLDNIKQKYKIMEFIKIADLQIEDISKVSEIVKGYELFSYKTSHYKYNGNNNIVDLADIGLYCESTGTQKMVALAEPLIDALSNGKILVIDELDTSLHPLITHKIIELFNGPDNKNNAQLIITTHDTNLLSKKLFRRDQIWFTEKDKYGRSDLYSLVNFQVRKDASYEKDYLMGKYEAIPFVGDSSQLFDDDPEK
jgi:AAA15 family ATPase/GTPase